MKENTYSAYERRPGSSKHTPLDYERAKLFGRKFKVNWVWLLSGEETPHERTPAQARVVEIMSRAPEVEQEHILELIGVAVRRSAS